MLRKVFTCCLLGWCVFLPVTLANLSACDKADGKEVLSCALDATTHDQCPASIDRRNKTLEPFCSISRDAQRATAQDERHFEFFVEAYEKSFKDGITVLPAANVVLVAKSKHTVGFVMWIHVKNYDRCRYIDITNATKFQESLTMSYDCMHFESGEIGYQFTLTVTELPSRIQRILTCVVPDLGDLNPEVITNWKSMICWELFYGEKKNVDVWFQTAPYNKFGNFSYNVLLYKDDSVWENRTVFPTVQFQSSVEKLEFANLPSGNYSVKIIPLHPNCEASCLTTTSSQFKIEMPPQPIEQGFSTLHAALISGVVFVLLSVFIVSLIWSRMKMPVSGRASVLLVYVWDRKSHFKVVQKFAELLKELNFQVRFDDWEVRGQDPSKWARQCVVQADFVVIVWSDVAVRSYGNNMTDSETREEPTFLTSHLFKPILEYVLNRINNSCKFYGAQHPANSVCHVFWDSSMKAHIPDEFKYLPTYVLPKKFSKLLRYLNGNLLHSLPCEPCLPGENIQKCKEYPKFIKLLENYKSEKLGGCANEFEDCDDDDDDYQPQPLLHFDENAGVESLSDQGYASLSTDASIQPVCESLPVYASMPSCVDAVCVTMPTNGNASNQPVISSSLCADIEGGAGTGWNRDDDVHSLKDRSFLDELLNKPEV